ncbi:hypothetical protein [Elizabethkingia anophelis]|uniref:hypothetical protein n=1 Tax=Elizabethkingia anophelis TaxID=1117645 RepID=UPI001C8733B6|nr:hypothetical protein [Elizabethkingia anophelis]MYY27426.1 hypothetical protein [Elizabethkingia anophelis]
MLRLLIVSFITFTSCRSTDADQDDILIGGKAAVKINLLGDEYGNSNKRAQQASINQKGTIVDNSVQRYNVLLSPSSFLSADLESVTVINTVASISKNLSAMAAV